jgi:hypothetical protein
MYVLIGLALRLVPPEDFRMAWAAVRRRTVGEGQRTTGEQTTQNSTSPLPPSLEETKA